MLRRIFAISTAIGVLAFVVHLVVFFAALRHGAPKPTGSQIYRIVDHGDSAYVTYAEHKWIKVLEIAMLAGLGIGVPGELALTALVRQVSRKQGK